VRHRAQESYNKISVRLYDSIDAFNSLPLIAFGAIRVEEQLRRFLKVPFAGCQRNARVMVIARCFKGNIFRINDRELNYDWIEAQVQNSPLV